MWVASTRSESASRRARRYWSSATEYPADARDTEPVLTACSAPCNIDSPTSHDGTLFFIAPAASARVRAENTESRIDASAGFRTTGPGVPTVTGLGGVPFELTLS